MRTDCPRCGAALVEPTDTVVRLVGDYMQCGDTCGLWRKEPDLRVLAPHGEKAVDAVKAARHADDEREYRKGFFMQSGEWFRRGSVTSR